MRNFITSLPGHLVGVDFRILAPTGGYREFFNDVLLEGATSLNVLAVHRAPEASYYVLLRVYVDRSSLSFDETITDIHFENSLVEILTENEDSSGNFVDVYLVVHLDVLREGQTAGSLRIHSQSTATSLLTGTE